jgi:glycosyltransferase involved in cell wall biosynthesis
VIKLVIQVPCFNEEETLPQTLEALPRTVPGVDVVEWLVIDDGSSDRTSEVARECGADYVIRHTRNRGLAAAFLTGLDSALRCGADVIVNTDADNQYDAGCIPSLVAPVLDGTADMVVGERPIESISEFSGLKRRLQRFGSWVVRRFSGTNVADAASGFRAFNRETAMRLQVYGRYTYTMETIIQAGFERLSVASVPIRVNKQTRPSRLVRSTTQYVFRSAQTIIRSFVIYRPFRFFTAVGAVPFIVGLTLALRWLGYFLLADEYRSRLPSLVVAGVLVLLAVQIWMVAFIGDVLATSRRMLTDLRLAARRAELDRARDEEPG